MKDDAAPEPDVLEARDMPDDRLLSQCRWEAFRGPGPGGQKRNKTSSAVRLVHEPTGLSAIAAESRSQAQNRRQAIARLRHRLVLELRRPIDPSAFQVPPWLAQILRDAGKLDLSLRSPLYLPTAAVVLDVLAAGGWSISAAAALLGITTANLVRFLAKDSKLWAKVNQMRMKAGLRVLGNE